MSTQSVSDFKKDHPDRMGDEVYLGNFDESEYADIGWRTKRKGLVSYDTQGVRLGTHWNKRFPVFAKQDEIREQKPEVLKQLLPPERTMGQLRARDFMGTPFTRTGHFPDLIKTWCTACSHMTRVRNKHTGEVIGTLTTDLSGGNLVIILDDGRRLSREQLTADWQPVICHKEAHWG